MAGGIFLIDDNGELIEMSEQEYSTESVLQVLLSDYPKLLPGDQINPEIPRRWLLINREASIPVGESSNSIFAVDHLFLDQDAIPTFIEVKRSSDTRQRREVVGQMLDYAANAMHNWQYEEIKASFEARIQAQSQDPASVLADFLDSEIEILAFWKELENNLELGRLRLIFVSDSIPIELRRVVEFLNYKLQDIEVLALEIKQYVSDDFKTFVPRIVSTLAQVSKSEYQGQNWDEEKFFSVLKENAGSEEVAAVKRLKEWAIDYLPNIFWGSGKQHGTFTPGMYTEDGKWHQAIGIYSTGVFYIQFNFMQYQAPFDDEEKREEIYNRWVSIPGFELPSISEGVLTRQPKVPLKLLTDDKVFTKVTEILKWFVDEVKNHHS